MQAFQQQSINARMPTPGEIDDQFNTWEATLVCPGGIGSPAIAGYFFFAWDYGDAPQLKNSPAQVSQLAAENLLRRP